MRLFKLKWRTSAAGAWGILCALSGRIAGLASSIVIASIFGAESNTDFYYFTLGTITLILSFTLCIYNSAFIPSYIKVRENHGRKEALFLAGNVLFLSIIFSLSAFLALYSFSIPLLKILTGFSKEVIEQYSYIFQILSFYLIILVFIEFCSALLTAERYFFMPYMHPLISSLSVLFSIILTGKKLGISALPLGLIAGGLINIVLMTFFCIYNKIMPALKLSFSLSVHLKGMLHFAAPILVAQSIGFIYLYFIKCLASRLDAGMLTCLNYAETLAMTPHIVITIPLSKSLYPRFCNLFSTNKISSLRDWFIQSQRMLALILAPVAACCFFLANDFIVLLYGHGKFTAENIAVTSSAFKIYSLAIIFLALQAVNSDLILSSVNRKIVTLGMIMSSVASLIGVALNIGLVRYFDYMGLPWARFLHVALLITVYGFIQVKILISSKRTPEIARGLLLHLTLAFVITFFVTNINVFPAGTHTFIKLTGKTLLVLGAYVFLEVLFKQREFKLLVSIAKEYLSGFRKKTN